MHGLGRKETAEAVKRRRKDRRRQRKKKTKKKKLQMNREAGRCL